MNPTFKILKEMLAPNRIGALWVLLLFALLTSCEKESIDSTPQGAQYTRSGDLIRGVFPDQTEFYFFVQGGDSVHLISHINGIKYYGKVDIPGAFNCGGKTYTVTGINHEAFSECKYLEEVVLPQELKSIGANAFYFTSIQEISIPDKVEHLYNNSFCRCVYLKKIKLPTQLKEIHHQAFAYTIGLQSLNLPVGLKRIHDHAFYGSELTSLDIPDSVIDLGENAFLLNRSLKSVRIGTGIDTLKKNIFDGCFTLTTVSLPGNLKVIQANAFGGCGKLLSITLPSSVTEIGDYAFEVYRDDKTTLDIYVSSTIPPQIASNTFDNREVTAFVPQELLGVYQSSDWGKYKIKVNN